MNLETTYMGLTLRNPIIVSSSGLTDSVDKIKQIEESGAGALVLKSLFEEQIDADVKTIAGTGQQVYPEADDYIKNYIKNNSVDKYLNLVSDSKKAVKIPVIASINCISDNDWTDFAKKIEFAGADAIELNINIIPVEVDKPSQEYEQIYFDIVESVKNKVSIPVSVKIGYHFTNLLYTVSRLKYRKADSVILFNKFYEPDIDIKELKTVSSEILSQPHDIRQSLRWVAIISGKIKDLEISASTGIHDGNAVIKQLLAGAQTVQVCSVLYKKGVEYIGTMIKDIKKWMDLNSFMQIDDFRGKMNYKNIYNHKIYERSQFIKYFSNTN